MCQDSGECVCVVCYQVLFLLVVCEFVSSVWMMLSVFCVLSLLDIVWLSVSVLVMVMIVLYFLVVSMCLLLVVDMWFVRYSLFVCYIVCVVSGILQLLLSVCDIICLVLIVSVVCGLCSGVSYVVMLLWCVVILMLSVFWFVVGGLVLMLSSVWICVLRLRCFRLVVVRMIVVQLLWLSLVRCVLRLLCSGSILRCG